MTHSSPSSRRDFLRAGLYGLGITAGLPVFLRHTSAALAAEALLGDKEKHPNRILVVVELTGGNDGLNSVVPCGHDAYYQNRPTLGVPKNTVLKINDELGFHPRLVGFDRLYKDGRLAIVQGCSYPNPNLSHFTAMEYWHTGVPNGADTRGWIGRFADVDSPTPKRDYLVNIAKEQSLAVRSQVHAPLVFNDPEKFARAVADEQKDAVAALTKDKPTGNASLALLRRVAANAADSSVLVKEACTKYETKVDYGSRTAALTVDLIKVAALINAKMPTRVYYTSFGGWDTHANQATTHNLLQIYTGDAIRGFLEDMERIGRADDVAVLVFTEFGRRVKENASRGTDHGTATPLFVAGKKVKGGLYGKHPSLTELDAGNLKMTTDFRSVYATMIKEWMGYEDTKTLLKGDFPTLGLFA